MSLKSHFLKLFDYHFSTTHQLLGFAANLSEDEYFHKPEIGSDSIHEILFHLLRADSSWRRSIETGQQQRPIREKDYPDLSTIKTGFENEQAAWQEFLGSLSEDEVRGNLTLVRMDGSENIFNRKDLFQHINFHAMQHHAEIAQLLTACGHSPGNIDFLYFILSQA